MKQKSSSLSRRDFFQLAGAAAALTCIAGCEMAASTPPPTFTLPTFTPPAFTPPPNAQETTALPLPANLHPAKAALFQLMVGNLRFAAGTPKHPHQDPQRRQELSAKQSPLAAILCCSDSRVPPEIIFDQGLGDLFIVRVAGNAAAFSDVIASLEYAVDHLHTPLVLVLGHQNCGAVTAALEGAELEGSLGKLIAAIKPAVELSQHQPGDRLDNAIRTNIQLSLKNILKFSPIIATAVQHGEVELSGAYYSLHSGRVEFL